MSVIVLPLVLVLSTLVLYGRLKTMRQAIIWSVLLFSVALTLITEGLSLFHAFHETGLVLSWGVVLLAWGVVLVRQGTPTLPRLQLTREAWILMGLLSVVVGLTLLTALVAPPNTVDSMTYHMTRVVYWQQFESVQHFPSFEDRMLFNPPFAEFVIAHLQILNGSDRLANLPQWFAMIFSLIAVTLILQVWEVKTVAKQLIGAVVLVTLPTGIMQSSSTQNDYVTAMWVIILAWFVVRGVRSDQVSARLIIGIGMSSGLALLTKGTAYVYVLPLLVWFGVDYLLKHQVQVWKPVIVIGLIALTLNISHYSRNYAEYGSPFAPERSRNRHANETLSVPVMLSVASRNLASNVPHNERVLNALTTFHDLIGVDINEPGTSYLNYPFSLSTGQRVFQEGFGTQPLHLMLFIGTVGFALLAGAHLRTYLLVITAQFLLMAFLFKWQPWGLRLQLGFWVTASPLMAYAVICVKRPWLRYAVIGTLLFASLFWVMSTFPRPLISNPSSSYKSILLSDRFSMIFNSRRGFEAPYRQVIDDIIARPCDQIGIINAGEWEYPLVYHLTQNHREVRNIVSTTASDADAFSPCLVVSLVNTPQKITWMDQTFNLSYEHTPLKVYEPEDVLVE